MAARSVAEANPRVVFWGTLAALALAAVPLAFKEVRGSAPPPPRLPPPPPPSPLSLSRSLWLGAAGGERGSPKGGVVGGYAQVRKREMQVVVMRDSQLDQKDAARDGRLRTRRE